VREQEEIYSYRQLRNGEKKVSKNGRFVVRKGFQKKFSSKPTTFDRWMKITTTSKNNIFTFSEAIVKKERLRKSVRSIRAVFNASMARLSDLLVEKITMSSS